MYYESSSKLEVKDGKPIKALMKILPHGPYFSFQSQLHATLLRKYLQTLQVISKTSMLNNSYRGFSLFDTITLCLAFCSPSVFLLICHFVNFTFL